MEHSRSFRDLIVWRKAHLLVLKVYEYSKDFPQDETFGLRSQLRRSAVSVAANIAEGFPKRTKPEKIRFMNIAQGSLEETRYYLVLAKDLNYGDSNDLQMLGDEVSRLLTSYINGIHKYFR